MERVSSPADLTVRAWWHALRDALKEFAEKGLMQRAAALAYFAILSILPGVIVLVALLGVFGHEGTIDSALRIVDQLGAEQGVDALRGAIESAVESSRAAGFALVLGSALALWTASGYMGSFMLAMNDVYETDEARPFWKRRPIQLVITLAVVVTIAIAILALFLTGPIAEAIGDEIGIGDAALTAWSIGRWPLLFALAAAVIGLLYKLAPNTGRKRRFRWILPGSILATLLWLAGSAGFSLYVSNFASYSNTYGGLAGVVVFLIWLWLSNMTVLLGACFSAELERTAVAARRVDHDELRPLDDAAGPAATAPTDEPTPTRPAGERGPESPS
ncbi:MAG TPA: YihY/virulence factor BrkB family protein [Solirubrobacterales bacterium]|nr:YihY/virulence factor BrkB family protein [Solirubrobacterales bacterium]